MGLAPLREVYTRRRQEIRESFLLTRDATQALHGMSDAVDALVQGVCGEVPPELFSVVALGGYGRREQYPFSDVDLLLVYDNHQEEVAQKHITTVLHGLWDSKLHLGHQVWSLDSLQELSPDDFEFMLALLDARVVYAAEGQGDTVRAAIGKALEPQRELLIDRLVASTEARHAGFRSTIYQLEPDLKQAPGGLRDWQAGKWLLHLSGQAAQYSETDVENAHNTIGRLRILLHFQKGRAQNQLTHRAQEDIARLNGYGDDSLESGVESLMMEYFLNAKILHSFCSRTMRMVSRRDHQEYLDCPVAPGNANEVLDLFLYSVVSGKGLSDEARSCVVEALPAVSRTVFLPDVRYRLRDLLKPRPGLYRVLSEMYELGFLELLLPEFDSIKARMIRDFYHKYTVDEHTLQAIKNIEDLLTTEQASDLRFRSLLLDSPDAELLILALLLHDIGKSREGAHVDRSTSMAAKALRRFHFSREDFETVLFLIRNHLIMSAVIFRRDLDDPEVIGRFVDTVGDPGRLRLLCLLTFADIKAVGPGTLNDWKKDLLWQLYVSAYNKLTLGFGDERIAEEDIGEKLLTELPAEFDADQFERFLEGFPRRYLQTVPAGEIYEHFRLASQLSPAKPVQLRLVKRENHYELSAVTPDRYYLFARIVGLLSYFEMNILRGYGFSNRQNTVLDIFQFHDTRNVFALNPEEKDRFLELLEKAVKDDVAVDRLLAGKERSIVFRPIGPPFPPTVYFEPEHAGSYSIMEIVAPDSVGLLYRIGREISSLRCNIELVLIATEGNKAVDVFYLTHSGGKLSAVIQAELREKITAAIGEGNETDQSDRPAK